MTELIFIGIVATVLVGPKVYQTIRNLHSKRRAQHQGPLLGVVYPPTTSETKDKK